jgi:PAS domain-containing protein
MSSAAPVLTQRRSITAPIDQVGTWHWDVDNDRMVADTSVARICGLVGDDAARGVPLELFIEAVERQDRERVTALIHAALRTGDDFAADFRVCDERGAMRRVAARGRISRDERNRAVSVTGALFLLDEPRAITAS